MADVRLGDLNDLPTDQPWAAVLLLCGNLGLGGSWDGNRRLLTRLAELVTPGAVLVGDSVTPDDPARALLRIRYRELVTPWWSQYNIPSTQMAALVEGTGWSMEMHLKDADDHVVLLRRTSFRHRTSTSNSRSATAACFKHGHWHVTARTSSAPVPRSSTRTATQRCRQ